MEYFKIHVVGNPILIDKPKQLENKMGIKMGIDDHLY